MHVAPSEVADQDLKYLYNSVDKHGGDSVDIDELIQSFGIEIEGHVTKRTQPNISTQTVANFNCQETIKTMRWCATV